MQGITFLRGYTQDGCPFVISVVAAENLATGVIQTRDGTRLKLPDWPANLADQLQSDLCLYNMAEVVKALHEMTVN